MSDRDWAAVEKAAEEIRSKCGVRIKEHDGSISRSPCFLTRAQAAFVLAALRCEWTTAPCTSSATCPHRGGCNGLARVPREFAAAMEMIAVAKMEEGRLMRLAEDGLGNYAATSAGVILSKVIREMEAEARRWLEDSGAGLHTKMGGNDE